MSIRSKIASVLAAAALVLAPLSATAPAFAHDAIVGTSPSDGETVSAGAFDVSVTSSEDIMNMPDMAGNQIVVTGPNDSADAQTVSLGCIKVDGAVASVPVDIETPGTYTATWQLVSQDGHSQDGTFSFTVTNDSDYKASGNTELPEGCVALPMLTAVAYDATAGATPEPRVAAAPATKDDGQWAGLLWGIGFVVIGSLAGVGAVWLRERRKRDDELMKKLRESDPEL
jgi:methionine-rich copper-binding protein CopC